MEETIKSSEFTDTGSNGDDNSTPLSNNSTSPPTDSKKDGNARICTSKEYTQSVQQWLWQYHMHCATYQFMQSAMQLNCSYAAMNQATNAGGSGGTMPNLPGFPPGGFPGQPAAATIGQNGVQQPGGLQQQRQVPVAQSLEYTMPSLYRRMIAELIDFILLFIIKLSVTLFIIEYLGIGDPSSFILKFLIEEIDEDSSLEDLQQMLMFALVYRMFVCLYETFFLRNSIGSTVGGATPGKYFMGLRVVSCDRVQSLGGNKVLVTPAENLTYFQAFLRALIKNFSMAFFFPACITVFFNPHFRAAYDILTRTMVVSESNWHDVFQMRPPNRDRVR